MSLPLLRWILYPFPDKIPLNEPRTLILKGSRDPLHFDTEKAVYDRLAPVQGFVVPHCFGEVQYSHQTSEGSAASHGSDRVASRALVLSDESGDTLAELAYDGVDIPGLLEQLEEAFRQLALLGVRHGDEELHNVVVSQSMTEKPRVILVDFEFATMDDETASLEQAVLDARSVYYDFENQKEIMRKSR